MTADHFEEWFGTKLLPNVPPNSLIVMDNASYDSHRSDPVPVLMTISARHSWSSFFVESFFSKPQWLYSCLKSQNMIPGYYFNNNCYNIPFVHIIRIVILNGHVIDG